mmetsp:Transcript_14227/g.21703  ORF Transcript_14227/g.21703 Transcript_14227/m.21703 type:complete len:87 (-) Transcript_14227:12-272(-)
MGDDDRCFPVAAGAELHDMRMKMIYADFPHFPPRSGPADQGGSLPQLRTVKDSPFSRFGVTFFPTLDLTQREILQEVLCKLNMKVF